jgi:hypothetical protein
MFAGSLYVGWVQTYRKLYRGPQIGQIAWKVKYDKEESGHDYAELNMQELAASRSRSRTAPAESIRRWW